MFAAASCLVDSRIAEAGDVDTDLVTLKTAGGALYQISNGRRAVYGYDQRIEVFGSGGMLRVENPTPTTVEYLNADGATGDNLSLPIIRSGHRHDGFHRVSATL